MWCQSFPLKKGEKRFLGIWAWRSIYHAWLANDFIFIYKQKVPTMPPGRLCSCSETTPVPHPCSIFFFGVEESTSQQGAHMRGAHIFLGPHLPPLIVFGTVQGLPSGHFPPFRGVKKRTDISHCGGC